MWGALTTTNWADYMPDISTQPSRVGDRAESYARGLSL